MTRGMRSIGSLCLVAGTLVGLLATGCRSTRLDGQWTAEPIRIDGDARDWDHLSRAVLEEQQISLGLCNDTERLYLFFRFNDPKWARAIARHGLTIWFDSRAGKEKSFGILYRNRLPGAERLDPQPDERPMSPGDGMSMPFTEEMVLLRGPKSDRLHIRADGASGPAAGYGMQGGGYTCEFAIPLSNESDEHGIGCEVGDRLSIGIEFSDMDRDETQRMRERMDGRGRGPGKGMRGGGPHGGGGGPARGNRPRMMESEEVWIRTILATGPPRIEDSRAANREVSP